MTGRRAGHGFTLIEVLVSVSLLALLLIAGYSAIRTATRSAKSGEALIARSEELRTAQTFLRRQLTGAMSLVFRSDDRSGEVYRFEGEADTVRFVAPMPGYLSHGGPHVQQLSLVDGRDGVQLEFRHSQLNGFEAEDEVGGEEPPVVLLAGARDGRFEFRKREADGELGDWSSDWDDPQLLPEQIRLVLEFERGDPRHWPDLEVAVRSAGANTFGFAPPPMAPRAGPAPPNNPNTRPER